MTLGIDRRARSGTENRGESMETFHPTMTCPELQAVSDRCWSVSIVSIWLSGWNAIWLGAGILIALVIAAIFAPESGGGTGFSP